jgi:acetamidase/formamidase
MDVPDTKPGNIVYLPVRVPGALFFTGDCHAGQGDGELCGVALEITAKVTVTLDLIKHKSIAWPRIESPDELMVVGSARPMEDAARIAYAELVVWLEELGWDRWEVYEALTQIGRLTVGNMVDTYYSLVAKIEKRYALGALDSV